MFSVASVTSHSCNVLHYRFLQYVFSGLQLLVLEQHHQPSSDSRGKKQMMGTALQRSKSALIDLLSKVRTYVHMVFNFVCNVYYSLYLCHCKVCVPYAGTLSFFHGFGPVCRNTPVHCARRVGQICANGLQAVCGGWHIHVVEYYITVVHIQYCT